MTDLTATRVADFMTRSVISVNRSEELIEAIGLMESKRLSVLPVVDDRGKVCGILSNSDLIAMTYELQCDVTVLPHVSQCVRNTLIDALTEDNQSVKVTSAMTCNVETVFEQATISDAASKMIEFAVHHLPVVDQSKKPVGIIATTDIVRAVAEASKKNAKRNLDEPAIQSKRKTHLQSDAEEVVENYGRWEDDGGQNIGSDYEWLPIVDQTDDHGFVFSSQVDDLVHGPRLTNRD